MPIPRPFGIALAAIAAAGITSCTGSRPLPSDVGLFDVSRGWAQRQFPASLSKGGGRDVLGRPYWMFGRLYVPRREPDYDRVGIASWVDISMHGNRTANGELMDATALVAAHPTLPLPSFAEVTNLSNGCRLYLRLNDRGPFVPGRIVDMSPYAAQLLGFYENGLARVRLRYMGPAPLNGDDSYEQHYLRRFPGLGCHPGPPRIPRRPSPATAGYRGPYGVAYTSP